MIRFSTLLLLFAGTLLAAGTPAIVAPAAAAAQRRAAGVDTSYGCVTCHIDKRRDFQQGVHAEQGIRCHDCHGGNPRSLERATAHRGAFVGTPDKLETVQICASCHADQDRMRPFGMPADELAAFRTSRHGRLLLEEHNFDAPTCTDCHDAHTIRRPDDARSSVHPTNIPGTCRACHENAELMAPYGIGTDQYVLYTAGSHGVAVFEDLNFAAPTCIGCHGSHSALPPGAPDVVNVCAHCHVQVGTAFRDGPHEVAFEGGDLAGCLGCHDNHLAQRTSANGSAEQCRDCHAAGSHADTLGLAVRDILVEADAELATAQHAIAELVEAGRNVVDARFRYQSALTLRLRMAAIQHRLNVDELEELALGVSSISNGISNVAEVTAEERWEHKLLLVPVWFLALAGVVFAWFKLKEVEQ